MDGLMAVTLFKNPYFKSLRSILFIESNKIINLDDYFGLYPSFRSLVPLFQNNQQAIVRGVGFPNKIKRHFDAQDYIETGISFRKGTVSGWLNRYHDSNEV